MDFWASWCGPCRGEIPHLKEAYAKYADKGVAFFSVSIDKSDAAWKKALVEENMPWEQVCAPQAGKYEQSPGSRLCIYGHRAAEEAASGQRDLPPL